MNTIADEAQPALGTETEVDFENDAVGADPARTRYFGATAQEYVERRQHTRKWRREQEVFAELVEHLPQSSTILDVPVGTGRFFPAYADGAHMVVGGDISPDMLAEARRQARTAGVQGILVANDAENLPIPDGAVDCAVCFRFLNWLPFERAERVIHELSRVTADRIILEVRVREPVSVSTVLHRLVLPAVLARIALWPFHYAARSRRRSRRDPAKAAHGRSTVHEESAIEAVFADCGLQSELVRYVDQGHDGLGGIRNPVKVFLLRKTVGLRDT